MLLHRTAGSGATATSATSAAGSAPALSLLADFSSVPFRLKFQSWSKSQLSHLTTMWQSWWAYQYQLIPSSNALLTTSTVHHASCDSIIIGHHFITPCIHLRSHYLNRAGSSAGEGRAFSGGGGEPSRAARTGGEPSRAARACHVLKESKKRKPEAMGIRELYVYPPIAGHQMSIVPIIAGQRGHRTTTKPQYKHIITVNKG